MNPKDIKSDSEMKGKWLLFKKIIYTKQNYWKDKFAQHKKQSVCPDNEV